MEKIIRFYLSGKVSKTVAKSQMQSWAELLAEQGIETYFILLTPNNDDTFKETISVIKPYIVISHPSVPIIRELFIIYKLIGIIRAFISKGKIIMQTRIISIGTQLFFLRLFFNIKILPDFRGIGESEYSKNQKHLNLNTLNNYLNNILLGRFSNARFFVSEQLREQYYARFKINLMNNYIFPCAADSNTYYFDKKLRDEKRSEYGLSDQDIVFLYSGKLDKPWQIPDSIFSFFVSMLDINNSKNKIKLFLLTPDETIAKEKQNKFNIPDDLCIIREADISELNSFYNLADFGLLFRKIHLVNETASPTKFAEYLLSGLPVLITEKIGDYSDLIRKNKILGITIKWGKSKLKVTAKVLENIISLNQLNNRHILSDFAKENLSKQYFLSKIMKILHKV